MNNQFLVTSACGSDIDGLVTNLFKTAQGINANLGFVYVTDLLTSQLNELVEKIRLQSGVQNWVGTVGMGVCCTANEIYDEPAAVLMLAQIDNYHLFKVTDSNREQALTELALYTQQPNLAVIHGNPADAKFPEMFAELCSRNNNTFFVGGLSSSNNIAPQVLNGVIDATISGVLFQDSSRMVVGHTQGCSPLENKHVITKSEKNMVLELDHRPAIEVFKEDIGEVLAQGVEKRNMEQIAGYIFAGFPIQHSDTNDYLVRNIIGFNFDQSVIAVGDYVEEGWPMMFCQRDGNSATQDMQRMLEEIQSRITTEPKGALYFSCLARGRNQFGANSAELKMIQQTLGDVPLVGFFANGEILHNRLYGYTGVLTVFV